jgi:Ni,Fe-hydrogenase III component G
MALSARCAEVLGAAAARVEEARPGRLSARVEAAALPAAARALCEGLGARLVTVTGLERRAGLELLYHFSLDGEGALLTLRIALGADFPEAPSLAGFSAAAAWAEREVAELLGVTFRGGPEPRALLLPDDWPAGIRPLKRKYRL